MKWIVTNNISIFLKHNNRKNSIVMPNYEEIIDVLRTIKVDDDWKNLNIVSTSPPPKEFENIFIVEEDKESFLTEQEKFYGVKEEEILKKKLKLTARRPKIGYKDMKGFEKIVDIFKKIDKKVKNDPDFKNKPIFLLGMAGTGKSRVAEAYAGENNIVLLDLNISAVAEDEKPIKKLNEIFETLSTFNKKVVLRLDEFEQMSKNEDLLGEMLTILNDLNNGGYSFKGMIILTSNNISDLTYKLPQFFRHGRFSEKLFISFPKKENIIMVMKYYNEKYNINFSEEEIEHTYLIIEDTYKAYNFTWLENRSPYVASEVEALFSIFKDRLKRFDKKIVTKTVQEVKPLLVTSKEGVERMYQKAIEQDFLEI